MAHEDDPVRDNLACAREVEAFAAALLERYGAATVAERLEGQAGVVRREAERLRLRQRHDAWRALGVDPTRNRSDSVLKTGPVETDESSLAGQDLAHALSGRGHSKIT